MARKVKTENEPFEHWQQLVEVFFEFCKDNFKGEKPSFDGSSPRDMKCILTQIRKRAEERNVPWTIENAKLRWKAFLSFAINDQFLMKHWTLSNLNRQKDSIFFNAAAGIKNAPVKKDLVITKLPDQDVYDFMN
jgi:hypothetical protein